MRPVDENNKTLAGAAHELTYEPERVRAALESALEPLGGMSAFVSSGQRVVLKPNFVRAMAPETAAVTHPVFIAEVARLARDAGASEVLVGDSPAFGSAANAARVIGLAPLLDEVGARIIEFRAVKKVRGLSNGRFKVLSQAGAVHEADVLINLPKAKAHCQMVMTGAVKNLYGCIPGRKKALMHCLVDNNRYLFGRMLIDNARSVSAKLHICDGILAMEGMGPCRGEPREWGYVLASPDASALDRVLAESMGYAFDEVPHLKAARDMKWGTTELERIEIRGAALEKMKITDWHRANMLPVSFNPVRLCVGYVKHLRQMKKA